MNASGDQWPSAGGGVRQVPSGTGRTASLLNLLNDGLMTVVAEQVGGGELAGAI